MTRVPPLPGPHSVGSGMAHGISTATHDLERLLFYGGLGALAATGLVSWPVAAAIGAGIWVASRTRRESTAAR